MNTDKRYYVIVGLLVVNIVFMFTLISIKSNGLEQDLSLIENEVYNVKNEVSSIEYSFAKELADLQEETLNKVNNFDYVYKTFNKDTRTIMADMIIELKEKQVDSDIYIVVKDEKGNSKQAPLKQDNGLNFVAELEFSIEEDYRVSVIENFQGNLKQLNLNDYYVYTKSDFELEDIHSFSYGYHRIDEGISFYKEFDMPNVNTFDIDGFGIESLSFVLYSYEEVVYETSALDQLYMRDQLSEEEYLYYTEGVEADSIDPKEERAVSDDIYYDSYTDSYVFHLEMLYKDIDLDIDESHDLDFSLILTYTDGREVAVR